MAWDTSAWNALVGRYYVDTGTIVDAKQKVIDEVDLAVKEREGIFYTAGNTAYSDYISNSAYGNDDLGGWHRYAHTRLLAAKGWAAYHLFKFVDTTAVDGNGVLTGTLGAYGYPEWTVANLCTHIGAPSDFFTTTPLRGLFDPANDYGFHMMRNVLDEMVWTYTGTWVPVTSRSRSGTLRRGSASLEASYAAAVSSAESDFDSDTPITLGTFDPMAYAEASRSGSNFSYSIERAACTFSATINSSLITAAGSINMAIDWYGTPSMTDGTGYTFDDSGDFPYGATDDSPSFLMTTGPTSTSAPTSDSFGTNGTGDYPDATGEPGDGETLYRGYYLPASTLDLLLRWNVSGGLTYVT